jgi:hypothetical protein
LGQFEQEFIDHGYRTFVLRHGNDVVPADVDTVLVVNSTMVVTHRDQLRSWCPLLVVLDEAVAFKTATAARTKAVYGDALDGAGGIIDEVPFVLAMSGTLAPAHNGELYPHLRALAPAALIDERGRIMRRHIFEKTFCEFDARRVAGRREVQVIVGSRNSNLLRKRIDPYVTRVTLREIAPTLPPERHEAGRPHRVVAGGVMMRLDAIREMIIEARCSEAAARPFPSGVRAEVESEIITTLTNGGASKVKRNGYAVQLKTPTTDGEAVLEIRSA